MPYPVLRLVGLALLLLLPGRLPAQKLPLTPAQYQQDFDYFWTTVRDNYCYFNKKQTDWNRVRELYVAQLPAVSSRAQLVRLLENALNELYDSHASLSTNLPDSRRLLPSGTDVWAQFRQGRPVVVALRAGYGAERVGLRPGMEIVAVNDVPIAQALLPLLGRSLKAVDEAAREVALNQALAGTHSLARKLTVRAQGQSQQQDFYPDAPTNQLESSRYSGLLESRQLGPIGYIRINNSLGNNQLMAAFDSALTRLTATTGLVLDLRETPGGGNTLVARALMGRLITQEQAYQRHEQPAEERQFGVRRSWVELVAPRQPAYARPVVVLVGRWTSSMGEGITMGLESMGRATSMGTEMARLNGSIASFRLPNSTFGFNIPTERLYRTDGLPRENFVPAQYLTPASSDTGDAALEKALRYLQSAASKP